MSWQQLPHSSQAQKLTPRPNNIPRKQKSAPAKSPGELAYAAAAAQLGLLQQKLARQAAAAAQLERGVLEHYYADAIALDGGPLAEQQTRRWHHYYGDSAISRARRWREARRRREARRLREEESRVGRVEDDVRSFTEGVLAESRDAVRGVAGEIASLRQHLQRTLAEAERCSSRVQAEIDRRGVVELKRKEAERRIDELREGRERTARDVEAVRRDVCVEREELAAAQAELRRRESVVCGLREVIAQLSRKRRQRE